MTETAKPRRKYRPYSDYRRWLDLYSATCARGINDTDLAAIVGCPVNVATRWRKECIKAKKV